MNERNSTDSQTDKAKGKRYDSVVNGFEPSTTLTQWRMESLKEQDHPVQVKPESTGKWPDEESQQARERLARKGVNLPWDYGEEFVDKDFKVTGLRAGGTGVVYFLEFSGQDRKRLYAAKTLHSFLKPDYLDLSPPLQEKISRAFLEETLPWLEMGQHPHIVSVQLLKNIVHPEFKRNVPFIFSEFIPRGNLKGYLSPKESMTTREALKLGIQLCDGLLHAYRHGLEAHKDIKPENIMVYDEGLYKITDFGSNVIGTPGYMPPEQVASLWHRRGKKIISDPVPVDHRTDQFALGLVMLESYLGHHPFSICQEASRDRDQARRYANEGVGVITDDSLKGILREILRRALSINPDNRYPDISSFRGELVELYESEYETYEVPEVAKDDSAEWWFHRGEAFRVLGRIALAEVPYKEALERYDRIPGAILEKAKCRMQLGIVYRETGRFPEAERAMEKASSIYRHIPGTELQQATCKRNLGNVYLDSGQYAKAEETIEEALSIYRRIPGNKLEQAGSTMSLGNVYFGTGRFREAENAYKGALGIFRCIPGTENYQARCFLNLGAAYNQTDRSGDAVVSTHEALKIFQSIPGTEPARSICLINLASAYFEIGRHSEAEDVTVEALKILETIPGSDLDQAKCRENLGDIYRDTGRHDKSKKSYEEALRIYRGVPSTEFHQARCTAELARCYWQMKNISRARRLAKEALKISEPFPPGSTEKIQLYCQEILQEIKGDKAE